MKPIWSLLRKLFGTTKTNKSKIKILIITDDTKWYKSLLKKIKREYFYRKITIITCKSFSIRESHGMYDLIYLDVDSVEDWIAIAKEIILMNFGKLILLASEHPSVLYSDIILRQNTTFIAKTALTPELFRQQLVNL